jgi:hypothetical protein
LSGCHPLILHDVRVSFTISLSNLLTRTDSESTGYNENMCTVTILPLKCGLRMAANRDESPLRPAALPPRVVTVGKRQAIMPLDPQSGGTWIAATDAGLTFTLLNAYPSPHDRNAPPPRVSRGGIIPALCEAETLDEAFERTQTLNAADYAGFRLVLADHARCANVYCTGGSCKWTAPSLVAVPLLFTSSGLGDGVVDAPRRELFNEYFVDANDLHLNQNAFHRHAWPDRRHVSVCMWRPEARTVSLTIVELNEVDVRMDYVDDVPNPAISPFSVRVARWTARTLNGETDQSTNSRTY